MPWGFAAAAIGGFATAAIGSSASQSAADTQAGAANQATATQLGMFNQEQANVAPWLQAGQGSLAQLQRALGLNTGPAIGSGFAGAPIPAGRPGGMQQISGGGGATPQPGVGGIPMSAGGADLTSILRNTPGYQWQVGQG